MRFVYLRLQAMNPALQQDVEEFMLMPMTITSIPFQVTAMAKHLYQLMISE
nr:hypothetical protein Iba_chr01fCG0220 [Ipomoea batatas]